MTFEVKNVQLTDTYLVKIRAVITSILLPAPYDKEKGDHNIVGLIFLPSKYMATHGGVAFPSPARPALYDPRIVDDDKTAVVCKKEITWRARVADYKIFSKAKLEERAFILHAVDETWVLELKDEETLFNAVSPKKLLTHLQTICGVLHAIDVLALQNEMQEYHVDSDVILKYINNLEATHNKSIRGTGKNPITNASLLLIATNVMMKTGAFLRTTDRWEDLDKTAHTWDTWKTAYKAANMGNASTVCPRIVAIA